MSGINRFLSKREGKRHRESDGDGGHHHGHLRGHLNQHGKKSSHSDSSPEKPAKPADPNSPSDFYGLFEAQGPAHDHAEEQKIKTIRQRIISAKGVMLRDPQILWALRSLSGTNEVDPAYDLLLAMSDASEGIVTSYDPRTRLLGAQNRQGVTCYLDATLFSMFSRLDSFEAMLYNSFEDIHLNKLGFMLRLWVNLLRSGKLITTDITKVMQETLAECGWREAAELHQQDASEAFTFITGKLELPLLTLKMDIYHTGREDTQDDHKFINERLLEVAIPPESNGERTEITLEECLEDYFNNRIEVRRYMERRSTLNSIRKSGAVHVETVELDGDSSPITPISSSPSYTSPLRPTNRLRTPSIIQERYIPQRNENGINSLETVDTKDSTGRSRAGSVRKEVMMPAWQFFSLIPWYTDNAPKNDAQVAAHFSTKRPILGLCLKRYSMTPSGKAIRLSTQIDIPVEIGVPHFIQDEHLEEAGALHGNFKLSLQSVVCHRGNSVDSGHYIALVRGTAPPTTADSSHSFDNSRTWMRFDDLAPHRITVVDIDKALKEEMPYLLFYQIVPVEGDPGRITSGEFKETNASVGALSNTSAITNPPDENQPHSGRPSLEIPIRDDARGRSPPETRRASIVSFSEPPPDYPNEKLSVPGNSARGTSPSANSASLGRTLSKNSDGLGRRLSKLARKSREILPETTTKAEIHVTDLGNGSASEKQTTPRQTETRLSAEPPKGHKREKSRGRLTRSKVRGTDKPDRECVVM